MGKHKFRHQAGVVAKTPRRGEIWLVVDRDGKNGPDRKFESSVQGGTRTCIIVSNDTINTKSQDVEVVYTTTKTKNDLPTHFDTNSTPEPSTVLCEQIMTVSKKDLRKCYGMLSLKERGTLDRCLKISVELLLLANNGRSGKPTDKIPHRGEIYKVSNGKGNQTSCVVISNEAGNTYSPVVEVIYAEAREILNPRLHFKLEMNGLAAVCDRIMTIPKKNLTDLEGMLNDKERIQLNTCLRASLNVS